MGDVTDFKRPQAPEKDCMQVIVEFRDGSTTTVFAENFGPMEGCSMVAFYSPDTDDDFPDYFCSQEAVKQIFVKKQIKFRK
jgi:hypothetical protein